MMFGSDWSEGAESQKLEGLFESSEAWIESNGRLEDFAKARPRGRP